MALRIACDLDGTLADIDSALDREAERAFGVRTDEQPRARSPRRLRELWSRVAATENFWTTLDEIEPGAVAQLAAASKAHDWEVIFLTQRPATAGETAQRQSQRWLEAHGFERPSVFVVPGSRGRIAAALDLHVVIDDRPENCLDVVTDSTAASLLIWRHPHEQVPPGVARLRIEVLGSMGDAIGRMRELDRLASAPPTAIDRVKQALRPLLMRRRASRDALASATAIGGESSDSGTKRVITNP
jgi:hypothetical protein